MSERMSITSKQASIHRYCPERCVALRFSFIMACKRFFLVFTWRGRLLFAGWRFLLLLTSYDDDRAYDMKLGGFVFIAVLLFYGKGGRDGRF
jgi:hypothetical protein